MIESYTQTATLLRILAHPTRLQILDELRRGEACVCHLQAVLGRPQAYVSQQLKVLRDAGVLATHKDGLNVYYHLENARLQQLLEATLGPAQPPRVVTGCPCPRCSSGNCREEDACGS